MSASMDDISLYTSVPKHMINEADYVTLRPSRSMSALKRILGKRPFGHTPQRPKMSRSEDDLSSTYSIASTVSLCGPDHDPHDSFNEWTLLDRRGGKNSPSTPPDEQSVSPSPTPFSLEEKCRNLLDEQEGEQKKMRKGSLVPRKRAVYGDPSSLSEFLDITREACAESERKSLSQSSLKDKWQAEKARGIHYPSVLKLRRSELKMSREKAQQTDEGEGTRPPTRGAVAVNVAQSKCKYCAEPTTMVPPGLKPSDWLPLVYLRRVQRCERQRPNHEQARKACLIIVNRVVQRSDPIFTVWPCRSARARHQEPSPLSNGQRHSTPLERLTVPVPSFLQKDESSSGETMVGSHDDETIRPGNADGEVETRSDSSSEYSQETIDGSEQSTASPGVYQILEVPELQWTKRYRVPKFFTENRFGRRRQSVGKSYLDKVIEEEGDKPTLGCDLNKPLPPLPSSGPPSQEPVSGDDSHSKAVGRSRSAPLCKLRAR